MKFKCHNCGNINNCDMTGAIPGQPWKAFCSRCGSENIIYPPAQTNENTRIDNFSENTSYDTNQQPAGAPMPPNYNYMPPRPPEPKRNSLSSITWIIISFAIAIVVGTAIWYFGTQRNNKSNDDDTPIELSEGDVEMQTKFIRDFYEECVFGTPTVKKVESACTPDMLAQIKESDTKFAMHKFLTGHSSGNGKSNSVKDIVELGDNSFRVNYIDNGIEGSSKVHLTKEDGEWKIASVSLISDNYKPQTITKTETVTSDRFSFTGNVDGYPIRASLTFTPNGNGYTVSGKYAYESTLSKYGDKKTSWINVSGTLDNSGYLTWHENIYGNSEYDCSFSGTADFSRNPLRVDIIQGNCGWSLDELNHSLYLSR